MLVDVKLKRPDPMMGMVLGAVAGGPEGVMPKKLALHDGLYLCGHWSFEQVCSTGLQKYWEETDFTLLKGFPEYGVCDSPEQFMEKFGQILHGSMRRMVVSLVEVKRSSQPSEGGWRWSKWGEYVGTQKSEHEYLFDEKHIESVFTFHVYLLEDNVRSMED